MDTVLVIWFIGVMVYAGGYCVRDGLKLKRTCNFGGYKFQNSLDPRKAKPASRYFGNLMICGGCLFLAIPLIFLMPYSRLYYLGLICLLPIWGLTLYVGKQLYRRRG